MKKTLVYKCIVNKWFFVALALYLLTIIITLIRGIQENFPIYGAVDMFYYGFIFGNVVLGAVFPVFPGIAFRNFYKETTQTQCCVLFHECLLILCCAIFLLSSTVVPFAILYVFLPHSAILFSRGTIYNHFQNQIWVSTIFQYLLNTFLLLIAYSNLFFAINWKEKKDDPHLYIWIPIIIYNAALYNPIELPNGLLSSCIPSYSYDIVLNDKPLSSHIISILVVFILAVIILGKKMIQERKLAS